MSSRIVRCSMSTSAAAATPRVTLPIIDTEAAERKAERLWGMADAQMPRSLESGLSEVSVDVSSLSVGAPKYRFAARD